jgi:hypothetical protein
MLLATQNKPLVNVPSGLGRFQRPTILALGEKTNMAVFSNSQIKFSWFVRNVATKPLYLSLLFLPIPIIGLVAEYFFDMAFSRSGAVLVCVAIFCVYTNHFLSVEADNVKSAMQAAHKVGSTEQEILQRMNPAIQGEARIKGAENLYALILASKEELPKLTDANEKLVKVEFLAGVFGTLIWGFGDLIPY